MDLIARTPAAEPAKAGPLDHPASQHGRKPWVWIGVGVASLALIVLTLVARRPPKSWEPTTEDAVAYVCGKRDPSEVRWEANAPDRDGGLAYPSASSAPYYDEYERYRIGNDAAAIAATWRGNIDGEADEMIGWGIACISDPGPPVHDDGDLTADEFYGTNLGPYRNVSIKKLQRLHASGALRPRRS